ncbi:MAG: hypothetical protein ACMXYD_04675 [Candidatus Woesearchaeota archaeon]
MRKGVRRSLLACLFLICALLFQTGFVSASDYRPISFSIEQGSYAIPADETTALCSMDIRNRDCRANNDCKDKKLQGRLYLYSNGPSCDSIGSKIIDLKPYANLRRSNTPSNTFTQGQIPLITAFGEISYNRWPSSDGKSGFLFMTATTPKEHPDETFTIQHAGLCAKEANLVFKEYSNRFQTESSIKIDGRHRKTSCEDIFLYSAIGQHTGVASGQTLISGDKRTAQGWMLIEPSEIVSTYQLPLFCSEIEVSIFNTKGFNNQVKRLSAESESQLIEFVGNSGNNLLRFLFTYDNYELTDYRVELDYQSSKVGGARYTITCVDPPNPHEDRDFCESSLEGSFGGNRSSGTGYGCCYTETVEEIYPGADDGSSLEIPRQCIDELFSRANTIIRDDQREQGVADEIILNCYESESNGGFCWSNAPREECGPEGRGERLSEDPSAYCCHPQSDGDWHGFSNTTGMPHLWNGTASNSTQDLFCMQTTRINQETNEPEKIGSLQYTSKKNLFAFDKNETSDLPGVWRECTEEQNNVAYGKWLCHNTTEELEWHRSSCSSELPNSCGPKEGIPYWLRAYRSQGDVDESFWTYDITTPNACTENKRINNQCCYEGRFFIEEHEHTHEQQTFTVKTACVSGTIITGHTEGLGPINNWFSRLGMASLQLLGGVSS